MSGNGNYLLSKSVITCEILAFSGIVLFIWFDEFIDIPYLLLGAENTPVNWRESLFESVCIILLGAVIINTTNKLFRRMKSLEGMLPICSSCKKIRDDEGRWNRLEEYISERSQIDFTHGICPECAQKLYPEIYTTGKETK